MRKSFGAVVRAERKRAKLAQDALAHEAKINRTYMGRLERDESSPTLIVVFAIAKALKIRPSLLIAKMEK